ncbi:MAG: phenylalanine--tRNA ligase subunit beta [Saprospiraceae bacterium]|nr:phenylalanine--tRNA ligase subunit beta [Saprospiraceae bacterium]
MKLSYNWLKQYVDIDIEPEKLSELLTDCGLEVESFEKFQSVEGGLEGIVVGEVLSCEKHPNADKLTVTTVNIGSDRSLPIVCGAPNVAKGQKVLVATVGTELFFTGEPFKIKKANLRGEPSEGMICAEDELGLGSSHDGIMVLDEKVEVGTLAKNYFNIEEDWIYEIGLTPNRADATSHIGSARDIVALINHIYPEKNVSLKIPSVEEFKVDNKNRNIDIIIEDEIACPRYSGITISGIEVKESPDWLKNRLKAVGLRPINNIVDITNFILMEVGQPLHAFDADKIVGDKVIIKKLAEDTKFKTLDEVERKLTANDLMICNAEEGMCIAGVFGGIGSGVTEKTKNLFIESAYFDPKHARKTSKYHGLKTDASFRFERGADPNITIWALKRAAILIKEIAGGKISSEIVDVYPKPIEKWTVDVNYKNIDRLIGKVIDREKIKSILKDLEIEIIDENADDLKLLIPTFKVDVTREADVIEEILRIYGYNNIEFTDSIKSSLSYVEKPDKEKLQNNIADLLSANGFSEAMNNSQTKAEYFEENSYFDAKQSVKILNPLSRDLNVLRQTLLFGGLETIIRNINHKTADLKFYEFGKTYKLINSEESVVTSKYNETKSLALFITGKKEQKLWNKEDVKTDFFDLKTQVHLILSRLGINISKLKSEIFSNEIFGNALVYKQKKNTLVEFGILCKSVLKEFDIEQDVFYADFNWDLLMEMLKFNKIQFSALPKFPEVRRDLAMVLDNSIQFEEIEKLAFQYESKFLKKVSLFDVYEGDKIEKGKKSYAVSFILQDDEKTLTDNLIDKIMSKLIKVFEEKLGAKLR